MTGGERGYVLFDCVREPAPPPAGPLVPRLIELVLSALQGLFLPPEAITSRYSVTLGIGRFLSPDRGEVVREANR